MRAVAESGGVLLLLSGGLDSATLLADLSARAERVVALTFDYGQRNAAEIRAAAELAQLYGVAEHILARVQIPGAGVSALLADGPPPRSYDGAMPQGPVETYVPMRNLLFLANACSLAEARGIERVVIGFNGDDATNYWDCTAVFVEALNRTIALSSGRPVRIEAPLLVLAKTDVIARAHALGVPVERTVSCYRPDEARACGSCLSCRLRQGPPQLDR